MLSVQLYSCVICAVVAVKVHGQCTACPPCPLSSGRSPVVTNQRAPLCFHRVNLPGVADAVSHSLITKHRFPWLLGQHSLLILLLLRLQCPLTPYTLPLRTPPHGLCRCTADNSKTCLHPARVLVSRRICSSHRPSTLMPCRRALKVPANAALSALPRQRISSCIEYLSELPPWGRDNAAS